MMPLNYAGKNSKRSRRRTRKQADLGTRSKLPSEKRGGGGGHEDAHHRSADKSRELTGSWRGGGRRLGTKRREGLCIPSRPDLAAEKRKIRCRTSEQPNDGKNEMDLPKVKNLRREVEKREENGIEVLKAKREPKSTASGWRRERNQAGTVGNIKKKWLGGPATKTWLQCGKNGGVTIRQQKGKTANTPLRCLGPRSGWSKGFTRNIRNSVLNGEKILKEP